jgi:hypothetical protein
LPMRRPHSFLSFLAMSCVWLRFNNTSAKLLEQKHHKDKGFTYATWYPDDLLLKVSKSRSIISQLVILRFCPFPWNRCLESWNRRYVNRTAVVSGESAMIDSSNRLSNDSIKFWCTCYGFDLLLASGTGLVVWGSTLERKRSSLPEG